MSEVRSGAAVVKSFRQRYVELFGTVKSDDALYEDDLRRPALSAASSTGCRCSTTSWTRCFDYVPTAIVTFDHLVRGRPATSGWKRIEGSLRSARHADWSRRASAPRLTSRSRRTCSILDRRRMGNDAGGARKAALFLALRRARARRGRHAHGRISAAKPGAASPSNAPATPKSCSMPSSPMCARLQARRQARGRSRAGRRARANGWAHLLTAHGLADAHAVANSFDEVLEPAARRHRHRRARRWNRASRRRSSAILGEQDILGDRLVRRRKPKKASDVLTEASSLTPGDLVVHADHGIGRFLGLKTVTAARRAPRLRRTRISRRRQAVPAGGKHRAAVALRLGRDRRDARQARRRRLAGAQGQAQEAHPRHGRRASSRWPPLREIKDAPVLHVRATACTTSSARGSPTRRPTISSPASRPCWTTWPRAGRWTGWICGDVGFGKTEVALRAAFVAVMEGKQVAVVVPTTLLAAPAFPDLHRPLPGLPGQHRARRRGWWPPRSWPKRARG